MVLARSVLRSLGALSLATAAFGQAAVEYAAKSSTSALSGSGGVSHVGVCPVDNALITCLSHTYPVAFQGTVLAICAFLALVVMARNSRRV
jgi:hypothetical protein